MLRGNKNKRLLVVIVSIVGCLAVAGPVQAQWQEQDKLTALDGDANDYFGDSVSIGGEYVLVGAPEADGNEVTSGAAYIFTPNEVDPNNWDQQAKLTASDGASWDLFGASVSIGGEYVLVGAPEADGNEVTSGAAYIFTPNEVDPNNWDQQDKLTASDGESGDWFGFSVSISGDYAIVGAYGDDDEGSRTGSAYIFKRSDDLNDPNWYQQAKLTASDAAAIHEFGSSVSISGDYAIVGAPYADGNEVASGSAYIFTPNDIDPNNWNQQAKLTASDGASGDWFGIGGDQGGSVSISADYAIVGAPGDDDNSGSAYIFERPGAGWVDANETAKLTASDAYANDRFGNSVSVNGDYAIVGAYQNDDNGVESGSAYIFKYGGASWTQQDKLTASDGEASDFFGLSVSISADYAMVGAVFGDGNEPNSGSAYVFQRLAAPVDWWPMFHHDLNHTGYSTSTAPDTNNLLWSYTASDHVWSSPAVADGNVYVGSHDCNVYCLDASTGVLIWTYTTGDFVLSSPAVADDKVYVGSYDCNVYCLPANDPNGDGVIDPCEVIWSYTTGGKVVPSPVVADGNVYVGSDDLNLYCLNAVTGAHVWEYTTSLSLWLDSSPAVADGKVYVGSWVGSNEGKVYCLPANDPNGNGIIDDNEVIWSYTTGGRVFSSPAVADGKVYVGSDDNKVYCLPADDPNSDGVIDDNEVVWSYTTLDEVTSSPAVADGKVYVGSKDWNVYCLPADDPNGDGVIDSNEVIWTYATGAWVSSSPAVADGKVYVGSDDGKVYCLPANDPNGDGVIDDSEVIWSYQTGDDIDSSPAVADGKVYIGSWDAKVYAFGPPPPDTDGDGIPDDLDNCPDVCNPDQNDSDGTVLEDFVSYWKFDQGSGATAYDSANGNDGTIHGPAWTTGKVDGALSFDGDDYVEVPNDPNLNFGTQTNFTIEAWIKTDSGGDSKYAIVKKGLNPPQYGLTIGFAGPDYADRLVVYVDNWVFKSESAGTVNDNQWHHVAGVVDRDSYVKLYIDGILDKTHNTITNDRETSSTSPLCIGATEGVTNYIHGLIDEVAIYNRALPQGEIRRHYQNGLTEHGYTGDGIGDECECDAANIDGVDPVDFIDFAILANDWLLSGPALAGDINRDQSVDYFDAENLTEHWLETCACIDADGDGYGNPTNPRCSFPELDCDDTDPNVNPGAEEICDDAIDNDCDGLTDLADANCWPACWSWPTQCHADADEDGVVNLYDFWIFRDAWKTSYGEPNYNPCADFSRDGSVDTVDLAELAYWFFTSIPADCPPGEIFWPGCWNSPTQCYGDATGDGYVDEYDLEKIYPGWVDPAWDTTYPDPNYNPCVDFNRDGNVDYDDMTIWTAYFEQVPDPNCPTGGTWPP